MAPPLGIRSTQDWIGWILLCMFTTLQIRKRTRKKLAGKTNQQGLETGYQMTPGSVVVVVMSGFYLCWTQLVLFLWLLQSLVCKSSVFSLQSAPRLSWLLACSCIPMKTHAHGWHLQPVAVGTSPHSPSHWRDVAKPHRQTTQTSHCSLVVGWYFY